MGCLSIEQAALAFHAPGVAGKRAVIPHHAMTWNGDRQVIGRASARHGPDRLGRADTASDLGVGYGPADRDFLQGSPNPLLESRATYIER